MSDKPPVTATLNGDLLTMTAPLPEHTQRMIDELRAHVAKALRGFVGDDSSAEASAESYVEVWRRFFAPPDAEDTTLRGVRAVMVNETTVGIRIAAWAQPEWEAWMRAGYARTYELPIENVRVTFSEDGEPYVYITPRCPPGTITVDLLITRSTDITVS